MNTDIIAAATSSVSLLWALAFLAALGVIVYGASCKIMRTTIRQTCADLSREASTKYSRELNVLPLAEEDHSKKGIVVLPALDAGEAGWVMSARSREHALYRRRERPTGR